LQLTNQVQVSEIRWTEAEDKVLREAVLSYPNKVIKWQDIADKMTGRLARQCRERWLY